MIKPKSAINEEIARHTEKIFGLLDNLKKNPEAMSNKIQNELSKHKREMMAVVEENLVQE